MSLVFELDQDGFDKRVADAQLSGFDANEETDPGALEGSIYGPAMQFMRGVAGLGRSAGMILGGTLGRAADVAGEAGQVLESMEFDQQGKLIPKPAPVRTDAQDFIFSATDKTAGAAYRFFTPNANEVGVVGRVLGALTEMAPAVIAGGGSPVLLAPSVTSNVAQDLVDQGVDAGTAGTVGAIEGLGTYAGFKIPFFGKSLSSRLVTGAGTNLALGMGLTAADRQILESRGYADLAQNYDPLDAESRAIDLLMGVAFGGLAHLGARSMERSERAAVAAANNAKHFQEDTAPGILGDIEAKAAHQRAMTTAVEQLLRGEPVSIHPDDIPQVMKPRPEREAAVPEELQEFEANREADAKALRDVVELEAREVESLIPRSELSAIEDQAFRDSLTQMYEGSARVKKTFDASVRNIAQEIGTPHDPLVPKTLKGVARAVEKIIDDYKDAQGRPDPTQIKDLVRATIVVDSLERGLAAVEAAKARLGEPTKFKNSLDETVETLEGYRDINTNFRVNGQIVELQVNLPEMLKAKDSMHKLYEEKRTLEKKSDPTAKELERLNELLGEMRKTYAAAWNDALSRLKASSEITTPSLIAKPKVTGRPSGTSKARTAAPSGEGITDTGTPSTSKNAGSLPRTGRAMGTSDGIVPEPGFESPVISSVKELLIQEDIQVPTGEIDAEGKIVVRSGREVMAEAEAEIVRAQETSKGIEAAVSCFLTRGFDNAS
jgi:hypothetical protein